MSENQPTASFASEQSDERLAELIVYVSQKCARHGKFGATKLNKILFYADFVAFQKYGKPITGAEYMKLPKGPVPRRLVPQREALLASGAIEEIEMMVGSYRQKRTIAKRQARLELFSAKDIALVDEVIEGLEKRSAEEVSAMSHKFIGWKLANDRETIPYETVFLSNELPTQADMEWARQLSESEGWNV